MTEISLNNCYNNDNNCDDNVDDNDYDDEIQVINGKPSGERWEPVGASDDQNIDLYQSHLNSSSMNHDLITCPIPLKSPPPPLHQFQQQQMQQLQQSPPIDINRIKSLEEEQEILTTSLLALTTHFAQVQFRLRQIVDSPQSQRDLLLKNLEEFAFRGIPEIKCLQKSSTTTISNEENNGSGDGGHDNVDGVCSGGNDDEFNDFVKSRNKNSGGSGGGGGGANKNDGDISESGSGNDLFNLIENQRLTQHDLIKQLKLQLEDLENYAYENGEPILPQSILIKKQKIIIDELKCKINFNLNELDLQQLTGDDLRNHVDTAIGELISPLKMKEQLVNQLKTQINDLERFIIFLQCETSKTTNNQQDQDDDDDDDGVTRVQPKRNNSNPNTTSATTTTTTTTTTKNKSTTNQSINNDDDDEQQKLNNKAFNVLTKASTLLQLFAVMQFGCGSSRNNGNRNHFQRNTLKKTTKGNHWGDIRAQLEVDIQEVLSLAHQLMIIKSEKISSSSSSSQQQLNQSNNNHNNNNTKNHKNKQQQLNKHHKQQQQLNEQQEQLITNELTTIVRKNFSLTLQRLIEHGLCGSSSGGHSIINGDNQGSDTITSLVPFIGCFGPSSSSSSSSSSTNNHYHNHNYNYNNQRRMKQRYNETQYYQHQHQYSNSNCNNGDDSGVDTTIDDEQQQQQQQNYHQQQQQQQQQDEEEIQQTTMHAWELILEYYNIKNGHRYNETPARKLSESFNLDIIGGGGFIGVGGNGGNSGNSSCINGISNKQSLLSCIGTIIAIHRPYKRSYNTHFKAFVCAGLNSKKLIQWLHLMFQCNELIQTYYTDWSYAIKTEFRDTLKSLEKLTKYEYDLPVDLAVRQFKNIKDVFM